jgi:hypothetical protein
LHAQDIVWTLDVFEGTYEVYGEFSQPIYPGTHLPPEDMPLFRHYSPENPLKIRQERANVLVGSRPEDR